MDDGGSIGTASLSEGAL